MASKSKGDIQLSFKKNAKSKGGMFYKKYKDPKTGKWKAKYFGAGRCKSDRAGHRKAVANCLAYEEERELQHAVRRIYARSQATLIDGFLKASDAAAKDPKPAREHMQAFVDALVKQSPRVDKPKELHEMTGDELAQRLLSPEALAQQILYIRQAAERKAAPTRGSTITEHVHAWLETEAVKVGAKQLESTSLRDKKSGIQQFLDHAGDDHFDGNLAPILMSYRNKLLGKVAAGEYAGNTFNDKIKFAGQFIKWCFENEIIDRMPPCMTAFSKRVEVQKGGDPLAMEDVRKLWDAANDKHKCFIALALNCGMKTGDITALKGSSVQGDRVLGWRPKTKVPFNMKLWPLTQRLIERCRDTQGEDDYLFTNQAGGRIETDSYGQVFRKIAIRAQVNQAKKKSRKGEPLPAIFSQLRDTSVDLVDKMLLEEGHDGGLLQVFQQHKDGSTAAYYTNRTPETMRVAKLDQITDDLLVKYGLKL